MNNEIKVLIYGASGYTGKLVAESLAQRDIPFYFAGRNKERNHPNRKHAQHAQ